MTPGAILALYGQIRAGSFMLAFLPATLLVACNPFLSTFRWPRPPHA